MTNDTTLDRDLLAEAVRLTALEAAVYRDAGDEESVTIHFLAEFVAESESLEGHDSKPADVLDSVRDLVLA